MSRALVNRSGSTLLELLCTMLVIAAVAGVSVMAIRRLPAPDPTDPYVAIASARRRALERSTPEVITVRIAGVPHSVSVAADGTIAADSVVHLELLTGMRTDVAR
jgi:hypothetical protein